MQDDDMLHTVGHKPQHIIFALEDPTVQSRRAGLVRGVCVKQGTREERALSGLSTHGICMVLSSWQAINNHEWAEEWVTLPL